MTTCRCPACTDQPRETYTRAHMLACELASILAMNGKKDRAEYFDLVAKHRGKAAAVRLREQAIAAWKAAQNSVPVAGGNNSGSGLSPTGIRGAR